MEHAENHNRRAPQRWLLEQHYDLPLKDQFLLYYAPYRPADSGSTTP
jgi:hypothetical protein